MADYCVWKDALGEDHIQYFVDGISAQQKSDALTKVELAGLKPVDAIVTFNGPLPPEKVLPPPGPTVEERLVILETKVKALEPK